MTEMVPPPLGASPPRGPGATFRYTFTRAGADACFCSIHPFMTPTVEVTP
ncbi:hypothetical protein ACFVZR_33490 [Streptomyces sp. NPDC058316]